MPEKKPRINNIERLKQAAKEEGKGLGEWLTQESLHKSTKQIANERDLSSSGSKTIQKLRRRYQISTPIIIDSEKSEESKKRSGDPRRGKTQTGKRYSDEELKEAFEQGIAQGLSKTEIAKNLGFTQSGNILRRLNINIIYPDEVEKEINRKKTEEARLSRQVKFIEEKRDLIQKNITPDVFALLDDLQKAIVMRYLEEDPKKTKTNAEIAREYAIPEWKVRYITRKLLERFSQENK